MVIHIIIIIIFPILSLILITLNLNHKLIQDFNYLIKNYNKVKILILQETNYLKLCMIINNRVYLSIFNKLSLNNLMLQIIVNLLTINSINHHTNSMKK